MNRIFYIYTMSKNFKHICITELNLIGSTLGFGSANAYMPLTIRHSADTVACRAQLCYCHSFSIAPCWERQQKSAERLLITVLSKLHIILWLQAEWTGALNLLPMFWVNIQYWGWLTWAGCTAHKDIIEIAATSNLQ